MMRSMTVGEHEKREIDLGPGRIRFFPMRYPERLVAASGGNAQIVEIKGARTFVPLDQPARLAAEIAQFAETA